MDGWIKNNNKREKSEKFAMSCWKSKVEKKINKGIVLIFEVFTDKFWIPNYVLSGTILFRKIKSKNNEHSRRTKASAFRRIQSTGMMTTHSTFYRENLPLDGFWRSAALQDKSSIDSNGQILWEAWKCQSFNVWATFPSNPRWIRLDFTFFLSPELYYGKAMSVWNVLDVWTSSGATD